MEIGKVIGATRTLGAPEGWDHEQLPVGALPICDVVSDGTPWMVSAWEPTAEEIAHIVANGKVFLWIQGASSHPIVGVGTDVATWVK